MGALLLVACVLATACGKKGAPQPPIRLVPAAATDLTVSQVGDGLVLECAYPNVTTSGLALPGLAALEIWTMELPAAALEEDAPAMRPGEFQAVATRAQRLEGNALTGAIAGDRFSIPLPLPTTTDEVAGVAYGVYFESREGERSDLSNLAKLRPLAPPPSPTGLTVTGGPTGIEITWTGSGEAGSRLYRRDAAQRGPGDPIATLDPETTTYLDRGARFGNRYVYGVTALASEEPVVESAMAEEREIDYRDRYAPPMPEGLLALAEDDRIRLSWRPSTAPDLAGYYVYRTSRTGGTERLTPEPVATTSFVDPAPGPGENSYRVTAVDREGNESEQSERATAQLTAR